MLGLAIAGGWWLERRHAAPSASIQANRPATDQADISARLVPPPGTSPALTFDARTLDTNPSVVPNVADASSPSSLGSAAVVPRERVNRKRPPPVASSEGAVAPVLETSAPRRAPESPPTSPPGWVMDVVEQRKGSK